MSTTLVGALLDYTFTAPVRRLFVDAHQLAFDEALEDGVIDRPIELVVEECDGLPRGNTHHVIAGWRRLAEQGVVAVVGPMVSENGNAVVMCTPGRPTPRYTSPSEPAFLTAPYTPYGMKALHGWAGLDRYDEENAVGQGVLDRFEARYGYRPANFYPLDADVSPLGDLGTELVHRITPRTREQRRGG